MTRRILGTLAISAALLVTTAGPAVANRYDGRDDCGGYNYDHGCRHRHNSGDRDNRDDNRRAGISPGPFDRSPVEFHDNNVTICFPFSTCGRKDDGTQPGQPKPVAGPDLMCIVKSLPYHCDPKPGR